MIQDHMTCMVPEDTVIKECSGPMTRKDDEGGTVSCKTLHHKGGLKGRSS
jgi:hypothetical protein